MDKFALIAERKIREAMEQGAFDRLDGEGRPLDLSENPFEDASQRMGHRLLRNNGFAPAWIEEGKDIDAQRQILEADTERIRKRHEAGADREWFDRKMQEIRDRAAALNRRIADFNLKAPTATVQKPLVPQS